jgi:hypothetical protein
LQAISNKSVSPRTLLVLGRVSNLPTVWSNCLAGWLLGGGGEPQRLGWLFGGTSLLYIGGMYLNDACDSRFDAQHRSERPIPAGAIRERTVWLLSVAWLAIGVVLLVPLGKTTGLATLFLLGLIVLYDFVHKKTAFSPVLMAGCRFLLYAVAASTASKGITSAVLWNATALAGYVIGLSYLARKESVQTSLNSWSLCFLLAPIVMAVLMNDGSYRHLKSVLLPVLLTGWIAWCVRPLFQHRAGTAGRAVAGLLAGIVLVDLLAVQGGTGWTPVAFLLLFGSALVLQRFIPAT